MQLQVQVTRSERRRAAAREPEFRIIIVGRGRYIVQERVSGWRPSAFEFETFNGKRFEILTERAYRKHLLPIRVDRSPDDGNDLTVRRVAHLHVGALIAQRFNKTEIRSVGISYHQPVVLFRVADPFYRNAPARTVERKFGHLFGKRYLRIRFEI